MKLKDHSLDWARDAATSMHCYTASPHLMKLKDHSLDWARDAATSMHCYTASPHLMKLQDHSLDWARDAATSMHCYTASPHLMKLKDHSLDWARDAATSMHCYTASPPSRSSRIIHWIGQGMQPHRCTVILHRPPQEAQGSFIGLGEGCSHIGALLYCIAPSRSSRIIHWIWRGMQPLRCTVILHRPLMKLKDHSLDWARDAATSMHCYTASPPS